eukprot:gene10317-13871_t
MFALWMFGATLEHRWGPKRFIFFYLFTALGAAILHQTVTGIEIFRAQGAIDFFTANPTVDNFVAAIKAAGFTPDTTYIGEMRSMFTSGVIENKADVAEFTQSLNSLLVKKLNIPTVGASGAVFGVLIAFALYHPNTELFMFFIPFPIKAKYFVGFYAVMELYLGIQNNPGDSVAHFAHLGGALFGYILVKYWNKKGNNMARKLVIINVLVFLFAALTSVILWAFSGGLFDSMFLQFTAFFAVPADASLFIVRPWTIITHNFFHIGLIHLLVNMVFLYWLGNIYREYA